MQKLARVRAFWPVFTVVLFVAALLRLWDIANRPGFDWDEVVYQTIGNNSSHGLIQAKTEYNSSAEPYLYHPPFYFMLLGWWFRLFGSGVSQARILAATGSLVMLALLGLWLRRLIGDKWTLITVGVLAVDGWLVFTNRVGWIENTLMPIGVAALWLYSRAKNNPTYLRFVVAGGVLGLTAVYKHVGVYFLLAVVIDWMICRRNNRKYLTMLGVSFAVISSYITFMAATYRDAYWGESFVQFNRVTGQRASRGAINSLTDIIQPLLAQYKMFAVTMLVIVAGVLLIVYRLCQIVKRRSFAVLGSNTILFAWALAAVIFLVVMQLKLPHYLILIILPVFVYLGSELSRVSNFRLNRTVTALVAGIVLVNLAVFGIRIVGHTDNALLQTAQWTKSHLSADAKVLTEESVGAVIDQPYCKFGFVQRCADTADFIITYDSYTQKPPQEVTEMLKSSVELAEFTGFKEQITVYRVTR